MTTFYRCTHCGSIVELDLERSDGYVPRCREEIINEIEYSNNTRWETDICGGRLECVDYNAASKGDIDERNIDR